MRSKHLFTTAAALCGLITALPQAKAQSACGEETCPVGHTCNIETYDNCKYACDNTEDGSGECQTADCETKEYAYCQRAACESDADCGSEMVCHTFASTACSGATACAPGEDCMLVDPQPCVEQEYKQCTPRAELPCQTAADCGEGYDCEPAVSCWCSGGMAAEAADNPAASAQAGAPVPPPTAVPPSTAPDMPAPPADPTSPPEDPADCGCSPTGVNYCQLQQIACTTDADCPAHFNCILSPSSCWADSQGNSGCSEGSAMCYPETVPGGGVNPSTPTTDGPTSDPQGDTGTSDETAEGPTRDADDAAGPGKDHDSVGGIFALFGCSVESTLGRSSHASWVWLTAGFASMLIRRRRR